jgi:hypothetical protein
MLANLAAMDEAQLAALLRSQRTLSEAEVAERAAKKAAERLSAAAAFEAATHHSESQYYGHNL